MNRIEQFLQDHKVLILDGAMATELESKGLDLNDALWSAKVLAQWNALKLLNEKGEFLNAAEGAEVLRIAAAEDFEFADVDHLGKVIPNATYKQKHIESVLNLLDACVFRLWMVVKMGAARSLCPARDEILPTCRTRQDSTLYKHR